MFATLIYRLVNFRLFAQSKKRRVLKPGSSEPGDVRSRSEDPGFNWPGLRTFVSGKVDGFARAIVFAPLLCVPLLFATVMLTGPFLIAAPAFAEEKLPPMNESLLKEKLPPLPEVDVLRELDEDGKEGETRLNSGGLKKPPLVKRADSLRTDPLHTDPLHTDPLNADPLRTDPLKQALIDYRAKRIDKAIVGFELAAKDKSFIARYLLAHIYRTGKGGVVDHSKAYEYYRSITSEFSDEGVFHSRKAPYVAHAYVQLARYLEAGVIELDIKSDPQLARMLFEKAAHYGDIEGQYQLGRFLIESGKERNVKLGQRWLTRAAMKNNAKAQAYLGALYWQGDLIKRQQSLALAWIEFARRNATGSVKNQVERLYRAVKFDASDEAHNRAEFFIGRLRSKYHVLWREVPATDKDEDALLDGIILADPPEELDQEQLEAKLPPSQLPDMGAPGRNGVPDSLQGGVTEGPFDSSPSTGFGYQMFDYGGSYGR